jgi:predicted lipid carrier protein YhbT
VPALAFLSSEWLRALDAALRAAPMPDADGSFVLEQVVVDVPGVGEVRYAVVVDGTGARIEATTKPDVRLTTDYEMAVAIASGSGNAQQALALGRLRIGGDLEAFAAHASLLVALRDASATLRSDTTFGEP